MMETFTPELLLLVRLYKACATMIRLRLTAWAFWEREAEQQL